MIQRVLKDREMSLNPVTQSDWFRPVDMGMGMDTGRGTGMGMGRDEGLRKGMEWQRT